MKRHVNEVMTREVVMVRESMPFWEVARLLVGRHVSALPVVDPEGRIVGVVSESDLLSRERAKDQPSRRRRLEGARRRAERRREHAAVVGQLMTAPAVTVDPDTTIAEAARIMHHNSVKRLPVVDAQRHVIGIVSRRDLLRTFIRDDEEIKAEIVRDVFQRTLWLDPVPVDVTVRRGVVTLRGQVDRRSLVELAVALVRRVDGVVGVESEVSYRLDDGSSASHLPGFEDAL